jgi:8-amino-7-oxononanoate synthase
MTAYQSQAQKTVARVRRALEPASDQGNIAVRRSSIANRKDESSFADLPEYEVLRISRAVGDIAGIANPFHRLHDTRASDTSSIGGRLLVNFSSYDYLGLNGHGEVAEAAKACIDRYGTSASGSRLSAGERQIHRDLEAALAELHGCEAALAFVSGHATNVSVIGTLLSTNDLILCDALVHNSIMEGARLSGAKRIVYPHGDIDALERALRLNRARHRRALLVVEGLYSMDGDCPDMWALIKLKRRYDAWLMVDEAHSVGVLGETGRGIAEEQNIDPANIEIWMGTLSKTLAAAGGYIAGSAVLIELLKYTTPGFVYSVGLAPPLAAASLAAIGVMRRERWRLAKLRDNGLFFLREANRHGLDTGASLGVGIVPVIVGNSPHAVALSGRLLTRGFNVVPAIFPGVAENQARLRFFITSEHASQQMIAALAAVREELADIRSGPSFVAAVAGHEGPSPK